MLFDKDALDSPSSFGMNNGSAYDNDNDDGMSKPRESQSGEGHRPPGKRAKTSAAPKGARYGKGYQDRASLRRAEQREAEELEERIRALEDARRQGQIDEDTFQKQRAQLGVGGDLRTTHLVKGLDFELLRRVKAGEKLDLGDNDDMKGKEPIVEPKPSPSPSPSPGPEPEPEAKPESGLEAQFEPEAEAAKADSVIPEADFDAEFDALVDAKEKEVTKPAPKQEKIKKGTLAVPPPPSIQNKKLTRDEILKQFKAKRSSHDTSSALGTRFKKINSKPGTKQQLEKYQETIMQREQALEEANRQSVGDMETSESEEQIQDAGVSTKARPSPPSPDDTEAAPQPTAPPPVRRVDSDSEDEVGDIFSDAGRDYNAGLPDEESSSSSSEGEMEDEAKTEEGHSKVTAPSPKQPTGKRNYFGASRTAEEAVVDRSKPSLTDESIVSALKAARRKPSPDDDADEEKDDGEEHVFGEGEGENEEAKARREKFLEEMRKRDELDAMDLDMGFGGSRFADEEDDMPYQEEVRSGNKRKRGPKKKKGDKNSAGAVMGVLEGRKHGK